MDDKDQEIWDKIFNNDPDGILDIKLKKSNTRTADERLLSSFEEINDFFIINNREPAQNIEDVSEFQLYSRLKSLREDETKVEMLKSHDTHGLLPEIDKTSTNTSQENHYKKKEINSIEDIFEDDSLGILGDDSEGLFNFVHTPKEYERAKTDFVARRKPCKDFDKFEDKFKEIHADLSNGKRKLIDFRDDDLTEGDFYVHNGVLLLLENINIDRKEQSFASGRRTRRDGRTRCIFENGTESNMLYRSLGKILYANGKVVTQHIDKYDEELVEKFINVSPEDEEAGYIYVLKSKSEDHQIKSINNLFKIGFTRNDVEERIKNAEKDPTFLMAPVITKGVWKCYNMNPQKFEHLLHTFFGNSCLDIDVFDEKGEKHNPKEWFIAPIDVIEQAIELIINGKIADYIFDPNNLTIVKKI